MKRPYSDHDTDTGGTDPQRRPWGSLAWIPKDPQGGGSPGPSRGKALENSERIRCLEQAIESLQRKQSGICFEIKQSIDAETTLEARLFKLEQIAMSLVANSVFSRAQQNRPKMKRETELTTKENTPLKVHKKTASHPRWPQPVVQSVEERSKPKRNQSNATGALSDKIQRRTIQQKSENNTNQFQKQ